MLSRVRLSLTFSEQEGGLFLLLLTMIFLSDLVRHNKPANHGPRSVAAKTLDDHNAQPTAAHARAPRQQEQAHPQPPEALSATEIPLPQQPMRSPPQHDLSKSLVDGERETKSKIPTYKGLEDFKLLEKMGE
jgi:hypothetical protein